MIGHPGRMLCCAPEIHVSEIATFRPRGSLPDRRLHDHQYNRAMPNRSRLHELVDSLPEAALAVAQGSLERFQTWPPKKPAQLAAIDKANMDRMLRSTGPMLASGSGTQSYDMGPGDRIEYGHHSHTHWEDGAVVVVTTHRYHAGHELVIEERLRLAEDGGRLMYSHSVTGPDATSDKREITFAVRG